MSPQQPIRSTSTPSLTEFILRLISAGHLTEKLVFLFSFGLFCFVLGFAISHQLGQDELREALAKVTHQTQSCPPCREKSN